MVKAAIKQLKQSGLSPSGIIMLYADVPDCMKSKEDGFNDGDIVFVTDKIILYDSESPL